jgi:hypothetical protein
VTEEHNRDFVLRCPQIYRLATKRIFVIVKFNDVTIFFTLTVIIIIEVKLRNVDRDGSVGIATGYRLEGSGIESRGGEATFSATIKTGPGIHPVSCTMGTGSFPDVKRGRDVTLIPHLLLVPLGMKE